MSGLSITVAGNITHQPELRFTAGGTASCSFTVAFNDRKFDKNTQRWEDGEPIFWRCVAWRDLAESVAECFDKGDLVVVVGTIKMNRWETKEGERRERMELNVTDIGASVARGARVTITRAERRQQGRPQPRQAQPEPQDPWATAPAQDDAPPF